ncbi:hypothetical protein FisN_16Hu040 [Fistulifera solaris]|uniref:Uncharacterized protein n=1 Tax=Fistulifera solaris TaxID=1519565 RepID=A0A1Z5K6X0_FISSO|nr:hypothetical protein FisN_16Hu040 [Fistulifera solaris]|eukprot:GAX21969.1 hypothetical protein FisN_16Hu040 [Fistulifera solaris]
MSFVEATMKATTIKSKSLIPIGALAFLTAILWFNANQQSRPYFTAPRTLAFFPAAKICKCNRVFRKHCPPEVDEPNVIIEEFRQSVPAITLQVMPIKLFDVIAEDSPNGFVPGRMVIETGEQEIEANEYGAMHFTGYFEPEDGSPIEEGAIAKIYLSDGSSFTASIDQFDGYFQFDVTSVQPGRAPALITFPRTVPSGNSRALERNVKASFQRQLVDDGSWLKTPAPVWCNNRADCPADLSFTLTWNTPTSDLDLHVFEGEPSGDHVYYVQQSGEYGVLDWDDTEGYGPENYFATNAPPETSFVAAVHCFSEDEDVLPQSFELVARVGGEHLWTERGQIEQCALSNGNFWTDQGDWSAKYSITATDSGAVCRKCHHDDIDVQRQSPPSPSETSPKQTNQVRRKLETFDDSPPKCESCLDRYSGYFEWRSETEEWKLYRDLQAAKNSRSLDSDTVAFWYTTLMTPLATSAGTPLSFFRLRKYITDQRLERDQLQCAMYYIMETFCRARSLKKSTEFIAALRRVVTYQVYMELLVSPALNTMEKIELKLAEIFAEEFVEENFPEGFSLSSTEVIVNAYSKIFASYFLFTNLEINLIWSCDFSN